MEMTGTDYYANVEQLRQEEERLREVKDIAEKQNGAVPAGTAGGTE